MHGGKNIKFRIEVRFLQAGMKFSSLCVMLLKSSVLIMLFLLVVDHTTADVFYYAVIQNTNIFKQRSSQPSLHGHKIFQSTFRMNTRLLVFWSNGDGKTAFVLLISSRNIFIEFSGGRKLSSAIIITTYGVKISVT